MSSELTETWEINGRIVLYLLENIRDEWLTDSSASKGRNVGEQFAHLHNVRMMWLKSSSPDLIDDLKKFEKDQRLNKDILRESLGRSARAVSELVERSVRSGGRIKGFKPHTTGFVGYIISHESHHRGQIMLALKQSGRKIEKSVGFGLWEWGTR